MGGHDQLLTVRWVETERIERILDVNVDETLILCKSLEFQMDQGCGGFEWGEPLVDEASIIGANAYRLVWFPA
jgi:hypothetical protein